MDNESQEHYALLRRRGPVLPVSSAHASPHDIGPWVFQPPTQFSTLEAGFPGSSALSLIGRVNVQAGPATPKAWESNAKDLEILLKADNLARGDLFQWMSLKITECVALLETLVGPEHPDQRTEAQREAEIKRNQLRPDSVLDRWGARNEEAALHLDVVKGKFVDAILGAEAKGRGAAIGNHIMCLLMDFAKCHLTFEELAGYADVYAAVNGA